MTRSVLAALALLTALLQTATAQAQDGRWLRLESPGFIVYSDGGESRAAGVVADLEAFDALLRRMTDAPAERSPTKLEVFLFSSDQFHEAFPQLRDSIRGVYYARVDQIGAYSIFRDTGGLDAQDVLFHEYAHHFMYQYFNNAYPAWYIEGFAEFVATASIGTERIVLGRSASGRANDLLSGRWLAMEQLLTATPRQLNAQDAAMFYAQSWLLTHYLVVTPGANARFQAYLRAMRLGRSPLEAFTEGFGVTPAQMQAELRAYLRGNPNAIALTRPAAVEHSSVQRTRLPASADRLLPLSQRVISGMISDDDAPGVLARVRQLTGAAPADRYGVMALARAEEQLGSTTAARALLEQYLAAHPDDVEALYLMGSSYLRDAHAAEGDARTPLLSQARRYFVRGYRIDGNHVPTLMRYAETYSGVGMDQATFDNYLNVLLLAHQLAPQVDEISLNAAGALLGKDRPREAIPILRAIAYDPHAGGAAEAAQQLLAEAQRALAAAPAQP